MHGQESTRAPIFDRRPHVFKPRALLQGLVGLVALMVLLVCIGLGFGLAWGAFRAGAEMTARWLTL
jgi:hypothetical protein